MCFHLVWFKFANQLKEEKISLCLERRELCSKYKFVGPIERMRQSKSSGKECAKVREPTFAHFPRTMSTKIKRCPFSLMTRWCVEFSTRWQTTNDCQLGWVKWSVIDRRTILKRGQIERIWKIANLMSKHSLEKLNFPQNHLYYKVSGQNDRQAPRFWWNWMWSVKFFKQHPYQFTIFPAKEKEWEEKFCWI